MYVGKYQFKKFGEYFLEVYIDEENQLVLFDPNDGMKKAFLPIDSLTFIERFEGIESSFERDSILPLFQ